MFPAQDILAVALLCNHLIDSTAMLHRDFIRACAHALPVFIRQGAPSGLCFLRFPVYETTVNIHFSILIIHILFIDAQIGNILPLPWILQWLKRNMTRISNVDTIKNKKDVITDVLSFINVKRIK